MIECIFTIDYEIYGNGHGSLREMVYEPTEKLKEIFLKWNARFVNFVEVAELEMIESHHSDPAINLVKDQIREFHRTGFELGLHLHPQWYNARYEKGNWELDYSEYNLCTLPIERIEQIVYRSITWLRKLLNESAFVPLSFRTGNWLFQPTQKLAKVLVNQGIKLDSSVFKGGYQHKHSLDYRKALQNGYYWRFSSDVNQPDQKGQLLEIPTYTKMVFTWQMFTKKRLGLQHKSSSSNTSLKDKLERLTDFIRIKQPLKLDFCRMTLDELKGILNHVIKEDRNEPDSFKPIVLIGHSKDLTDFNTVEHCLQFLQNKNIGISTFEKIYGKCYM